MSAPASQLGVQAKANVPAHVAIIMDGNGRWAKQRHLPRVEGHRQGAESVRAIVRVAGEAGVKYLARYLKNEIGELNRNNVRLEVIGQIYRLPEFVQEQLEKTKAALAKNNGLTLILALSYGGRTEIVEAVRDIAAKAKEGRLEPEEINEQVIAQHLYTRNFPDPDLLIRTSGEMRVSNFLLWQISYAELVVTPTFWPDFRKPQFLEALEEYARRHRRFGGL